MAACGGQVERCKSSVIFIIDVAWVRLAQLLNTQHVTISCSCVQWGPLKYIFWSYEAAIFQKNLKNLLLRNQNKVFCYSTTFSPVSVRIQGSCRKNLCYLDQPGWLGIFALLGENRFWLLKLDKLIQPSEKDVE